MGESQSEYEPASLVLEDSNLHPGNADMYT
jgi:hypothetical protein